MGASLSTDSISTTILAVHQQIKHEGILGAEPFEREADCFLPFDTESFANDIPLQHHLVDRLDEVPDQSVVKCAWPNQ
jgi:hypothetical protein